MANIQNVALVDRGKVVTGGGSGGHTIINESGTSLAQEPNLQFKGADISDDSTNNRTVVDMSYTEIDYEDWLELTEQEKETGRWDVVGVPGADGTVSFDLMTKLWENPDPTVAFAAQNIDLELTNYDFILTLCRSGISAITKKGINYIYLAEAVAAANTEIINRRRLGTITSTGITFNDAYYRAGINASGTLDNSLCVPVFIYGIKTSQTVEIKAIAPEVSTSASKCMMSDGETSVEDAIEEVDDKTTVTSGTITKSSYATALYHTTVYKLGNLVFISCGWVGSANNSQGIATVPSGFRPSSETEGSGMIITPGGTVGGTYAITSAGIIKQITTTGSATGGTFSFIFTV